MGLSVLFLQRHRVEVGLKLILERCGPRIPNTHDITALVDACRDACTAAGAKSEWTQIEGEQLEFIALMHEVDPTAATWRYPIDRGGRPAARRPFVNLEALEDAGASFEAAIRRLNACLTERESLPVGEEEADVTARELREVAAACRTVRRTSELILEGLRSEGDRLAGGRPRRRDQDAGTLSASSAVHDVAEDLSRRAEEMASRIERAYGLTASPEPVPPVIPPMPPLTLAGGLAAMRAQQDAQVDWAGEKFAKAMRRLGDALIRLHARTEGWATPPARQVKLDVIRFRSRFHMNWHGT
jgi:hypothetical protein